MSINPFDYLAAAAQGAFGAVASQAGIGPRQAPPPPPPPPPPPRERVRVIVKRARERGLSAKDVLPYAAVAIASVAMVATVVARR